MVIAIPSPFAIFRRIRLLSGRTGVIHVVIAVITAKGDNMNTSTTEENGTAQATATGDQPKPTKKARVTRQRADVAKKNGKSGKKASQAKKAPKSAKKADGARDGSKTAKVLELLKRTGGTTAKELMKATGWQHTPCAGSCRAPSARRWAWR